MFHVYLSCAHLLYHICCRLLGLCNNFAYVIMLSAAHDILEDKPNPSNVSIGTFMYMYEP